MEHYTVLSYIIGNYEIVHPVLEKSENARYVMVTDNPEIKDPTGSWEIILDEGLSGSTFDKCYQIRFNPFKYTNDNILIRIDGSISVEKNLDPLIKRFLKEDYDMSLMIHPTRSNMYDEYVAWVGARDYPQSQAQKCLNYMYSHGYDVKNYKGLYQMCFEITRRDNKKCDDWHRLCYAVLKYLGDDNTRIERVDQTVTSFLLNKYFSDSKVMWFDQRIAQSEYLKWYAHGSNIPYKQMDVKDMAQPFAFNKRVHDVVRPQDL